MATKTNYFDGNSVASADLIAPWASLLTDGAFSGVNVLAHTVANLSVDVQIGQAMKSGYYIRSDAVVNVPIASNTSGYSRIDLIVLNVDTTNKITTAAVVQGIPSSSPVAPVAGALQLPLAQVLVGNNISVLNQNVITDVRAITAINAAQIATGDLANASFAYTNSWGNAGGSWETAGYRKTYFNDVIFSGTITGGAANSIPFTLPAGCRPAGNRVFVVPYNNSGASATAFIQVNSTGVVTVYMIVNGTNVALDGIRFKAEQ